MMAKAAHVNGMAGCQRGLRINGINTSAAKKLRQKANCIPRSSSDHPSNQGALAKNPLVLHSTAAKAIASLPRQAYATESPALGFDELPTSSSVLLTCVRRQARVRFARG